MCPANKDVRKQSIIAGTDSLNEKYTMCDSFHSAFSERDDGTGYTKVLIPSSRNQSMRPRSIVFNRSNLVTDKKKRYPFGCLFFFCQNVNKLIQCTYPAGNASSVFACKPGDDRNRRDKVKPHICAIRGLGLFIIGF